MNRFKLGVGPMSREIIDLLVEYSDTFNFPMMIIASRNQVDYDSGYVCTTSELATQIKNHPKYNKDLVLICRDHCGPYFSDADANTLLSDAMIRCKQTIHTDIINGFDLIHIDTSRIRENQLVFAKELIEYAISLKADIKLEFGSEDNAATSMHSSFLRIDDQLDFLSDYKNNAIFFVSQTGSLTKHKQVGTFNVVANKIIADKIHNRGFLFKEHNADYLDRKQVLLRVDAGVDAINIAPELGSAQTKVICELGKDLPEFSAFSDKVLSHKYWQRWVTSEVTDPIVQVQAGGHYSFKSTEYITLREAISTSLFNENLKNSIYTILNTYRRGINEYFQNN